MDRFNRTLSHLRPIVSALLLGLTLIAILGRFVGLEQAPPVMHYDESMGAGDIVCLGATGYSAEGQHWPLFTPGAGNGFYTPVYLYFGALWTRLFGISIAAIRSIPACFVTLTIIGITLLAKRLGGPRAGFWALILASLSPWGFHFSRVAWDPPVAAMFVVWFCFFWLIERPLIGGALSGAAFTLALYSYPPTRVQAPLLFAVLCIGTRRLVQRWLIRVVSFAAVAIVLALPLVHRLMDPGFIGRTSGLVIFSPEYLAGHHGMWNKLRFFLESLATNMGQHLGPTFLFLAGDRNIRHSSGFLGVLSLVDDLVLVLALWLVIVRWRKLSLGRTDASMTLPQWRLLGFALVGFLLGLLPAALTHEGLPHALRSIGAWPFVALGGAAILSSAEWRWAPVPLLVGLVAMTHLGWYGRDYFVEYPLRAKDAFGGDWATSLMHPAKLTPEARVFNARDDRPSFMYFLMLSGRFNCEQSRRTVTAWAAR